MPAASPRGSGISASAISSPTTASASGSARGTGCSCASRAPSAAAAASISSSGSVMFSRRRGPAEAGHYGRLATTGVVSAFRRTVLVVAFLVVAAGAIRSAAPRFYPDDPIQADRDAQFDASAAEPIEGSNGYDFVENTFGKPGDRRDIPAVNVNTMDEVPDSSWFTNRIGRRAMAVDELVRGPNSLDVLNVDDWPIVRDKTSGITPGYRVTDPSGRLYQIKFDPPGNPEMASGAEVIGAAIYHALGYNVVEGYVVDVDPARIVVAPNATIVDMSGRRRPMRRSDIDRLLERAAR